MNKTYIVESFDESTNQWLQWFSCEGFDCSQKSSFKDFREAKFAKEILEENNPDLAFKINNI